MEKPRKPQERRHGTLRRPERWRPTASFVSEKAEERAKYLFGFAQCFSLDKTRRNSIPS
ncbi:hypothetical protein F2Q68_00019651 [Brassica cretica]|uniref:Uncharacterized protein n=1 Tax=Brassica cretica TaxID=69181 RepID=A0A8S9G180_BRACR|nr:hypothetical protein F2Q68_00019651 [Brassica cretica]